MIRAKLRWLHKRKCNTMDYAALGAPLMQDGVSACAAKRLSAGAVSWWTPGTLSATLATPVPHPAVKAARDFAKQAEAFARIREAAEQDSTLSASSSTCSSSD